MRRIFFFIVKRILTDYYNPEIVKNVGVKRLLPYYLFQRFFRINSHTKWPVHWSSLVMEPNNITIDYHRPYPGFMPGSYIQAINGIKIGKNVRIGPGVKLISANHDLDDFDKHIQTEPITIGNNSWLSADCKILPGVKLGNHTIVAAGAVVNNSFPEGNCIIGGVPARVIKKIGEYKS